MRTPLRITLATGLIAGLAFGAFMLAPGPSATAVGTPTPTATTELPPTTGTVLSATSAEAAPSDTAPEFCFLGTVPMATTCTQLLADMRNLVHLDQGRTNSDAASAAYDKEWKRMSGPSLVAQQKADPDIDVLLCASNVGPVTFSERVLGTKVELTVTQKFEAGTSRVILTGDVYTGKIVASRCA